MSEPWPAHFPSPESEPAPSRPPRDYSAKIPRIDPVALGLALAIGTFSLVICFLTGGDIGATASLSVVAAVLAAIWFIPLRWSMTGLLFLGATLEAPYEQFAEYLYRTPWNVGGMALLGNLNLLTQIAALKIDGFFLMLVYFVIIMWARRARGSTIDTEGTIPLAPPMLTGASISFLSIMLLWVYGIATGGQIPESLLQIQKLVYAILLLFVMHGAYRGAKDLHTLGTVLICAACYRAVLATYVHFTVIYHGEYLPCASTHADSRLFAAALVCLITQFNERTRRATHWSRFLAMGLILMGMVYNGRRLVWVAVIGGLVIAASVSGRTRLKRSISKLALAALPFLVVYVSAGWNNSDSGVFKPVKMIRSVVDSKSDGSSMWRDLENMNMVNNIKDHPLTGIGYGKQYTEYIKLPDVSASFPRYRFIPHNGLLVLFPFLGPLGVCGVFAMFLSTVFLASRSYRTSKDPAIKTASVMCIVLVYLHMNQCYGDIGVADWLTCLTLGPAMMISGKLAVETGGWSLAAPRVRAPRFPRRQVFVEDHGPIDRPPDPGTGAVVGPR
jgi:hypothetical protein